MKMNRCFSPVQKRRIDLRAASRWVLREEEIQGTGGCISGFQDGVLSQSHAPKSLTVSAGAPNQGEGLGRVERRGQEGLCGAGRGASQVGKADLKRRNVGGEGVGPRKAREEGSGPGRKGRRK